MEIIPPGRPGRRRPDGLTTERKDTDCWFKSTTVNDHRNPGLGLLRELDNRETIKDQLVSGKRGGVADLVEAKFNLANVSG